MNTDNFKMFPLRVHGDKRGKLVAIEHGENCPFEVRRAFYICDVRGSERRGMHANRKSEFLFVALSGSCKVICDDGEKRAEFILENPETALWTDKMTWKEMCDFSENAVLLVLASEKYDVNEYIRDYDEFLKNAQLRVDNLHGGGVM